jgi:flagellar biosynthesis protein FlhA
LILETIIDCVASGHRSPDTITEYVRVSLGRQICNSYLSMDNNLNVITLSAEIEDVIREGVKSDHSGQTYIDLDPGSLQTIRNAVLRSVERMAEQGYQPILLCSPSSRIHIKDF